jgi:hypothetical protein
LRFRERQPDKWLSIPGLNGEGAFKLVEDPNWEDAALLTSSMPSTTGDFNNTVIESLQDSLPEPDDSKLNNKALGECVLEQAIPSMNTVQADSRRFPAFGGPNDTPKKLDTSISRKRRARTDGDESGAKYDPELHRKRLQIYSSAPGSSAQTEEPHVSRSMQHKERPKRSRKVLPLALTRGKTRLCYQACPDSGSSNNIISLSTVKELGCEIETIDGKNSNSFVLANGKRVEALGRIAADCAFETGTQWGGQEALQCLFYVFRSLSVPLIMGIDFLDKTETYSKYMNRLIEEPRPVNSLIQVKSVGAPLKRLVCKLDKLIALATIDTGADLDLVSEDYARKWAFDIHKGVQFVEFADGSVGATAGTILVGFTIGRVVTDIDGHHFVGTSKTIEIMFHVLPGLTSDILIGQDTVEELNIFRAHAESVISGDPSGHQSSAIIRLIGEKENTVSKIWNKLRGSVGKKPGTYTSDYLGRTANANHAPQITLNEVGKSRSNEKTGAERCARRRSVRLDAREPLLRLGRQPKFRNTKL